MFINSLSKRRTKSFLIFGFVTLLVTNFSCSSDSNLENQCSNCQVFDEPNNRHPTNFLWSDESKLAKIFLLDPGQFELVQPVEPLSVVYDDNLSAELEILLREIQIVPAQRGPFPACAPEPGVQFFYLVLENLNNVQQRFSQENGCGLGYGANNKNNYYFEQPIEGVLKIIDFCKIAENIGVTSASCN